MIIDNVRLVNVGQFKDRLFNFNPHMNVIVGPNGSGKSTILNAIVFAMTGINRMAGVNTENISQFADPLEQSFIDVRLRHNNKCFLLKRSLRPDTCQLNIDDEKTITGIANVQTRLLSELGATKQQLNDYVFVAQQNVAGWFDKTATQRAKDMAILFGVANAEQAYDQLGKFIPKVSLPTTMLDPGRLRTQRTAIEAELANTRAQLATLADMPADVHAYLEARQQVRLNHEKSLTYRRTLKELEANIATCNSRLQTMAPELAAVTGDVATLEEAVAADRPHMVSANTALVQWANYERSLAAQTQYEVARGEFWSQWKRRVPRPKRPVDYVDGNDAAFKDAHATCQRQLADRESAFRQLSKLPKGAPCPTCGEPANNLEARVSLLSTQLAEVQQQFAPLQARLTATQSYLTGLTVYKLELQRLQASVASLRSRKEALALCEKPKQSKEELKQIVSDFTTLDSALTSTKTNEASLRATERATLTQLTGFQTQHTRLLQSPVPDVMDEDLAKAMAEHREMQQRLELRATLRTTEATYESQLETVQTQLDDVAAVTRKRDRIQYALDRLTKAREILHPNAAPRVVTHTKLEQMLGEINRNMEIFAAPARVTVDDTLVFWANFLDGVRRQPDSRLSVGQKIVLAMSLRIALNATYAGDLGHLSLDEPTAGLDATTLAYVPRAFMRLQELSQARGLQVFLVTHEQRLIDTFDNVIELSP